MPSLYGVIEKRNWAEHHLKLIETRITDFIGDDPYPVLTDSHPKLGVYHACLVYPKKLPARELTLMIGDCVHNMRSALDYIAWELAGASMADTETMFPIYETDIGFRKHALRRMKRLPLDAQTLIERLQPYNRRYGGHRLALSAINKLDATDKHKLVAPTIAIAEQVFCDHGIPGHLHGKFKRGMHIFPGAGLVHNAIIASFTIDPPVPDMQVNFKFTPQVEFSDIHGFPKHSFVIENLKIMLDSLDLVIKRFKPFF